MGFGKSAAHPEVEVVEPAELDLDPEFTRPRLRLFDVDELEGVGSGGVREVPGLHDCEGSLLGTPIRRRMTGQVPTDREVHVTALKVRFYELDPYDHVNHTNYFSYFETARIEYLSDMGWGLDVLKDNGWQFVVVELRARFLAAARYGQELVIKTWIEDVGRVKSTWHQLMFRDDKVVAELEVTAAFTDLDGHPRRIPREFVDEMERIRSASGPTAVEEVLPKRDISFTAS
jgi:acyl-CoA thioester hydrolase